MLLLAVRGFELVVFKLKKTIKQKVTKFNIVWIKKVHSINLSKQVQRLRKTLNK